MPHLVCVNKDFQHFFIEDTPPSKKKKKKSIFYKLLASLASLVRPSCLSVV